MKEMPNMTDCLHTRCQSLIRYFVTGIVVMCCSAFVGTHVALAADVFPDRPIKIVVPYPPGGGPDILIRILGESMSNHLGQTIVVENRSGAAGSIGAQSVARAQPDGYTLLVCAFSCGVVPLIQDPAPFDLQKDFAPVALLGKVPSVLVVNPQQPFKDLKAFMDYAKTHPNAINAASAGLGSSPHLAIELLRTTTDTHLMHVPYRGSSPVMADLLGGQVDVYFDNLPPALSNIKSGKLRALAVASEKRAPSLPDVPTFMEAGYTDFVITPWFSLMAPANTPTQVLNRLNEAVNHAFQDASVAERVKGLGVGDTGGSRKAAADFLENETKKWRKVVQENHIKGS